jgi:LPXTG-site transpeptidase (sortase) family protein
VDLDIYLPTPTPDRLPDYPIPTPTVETVVGLGDIQPDPSAATRIVIPAIGVDTVVKYVPFNGDTWLIGGLKQEVAWMGDTSWPGLGGNTGLAGHVDLADGSAGPFWRLRELKAGDLVMIYTEVNLFTYQMREQVIVPDYDLTVIGPTDEPQLTLITCTGWDELLRIYVQRLVVYADLVGVKPLSNQ